MIRSSHCQWPGPAHDRANVIVLIVREEAKDVDRGGGVPAHAPAGSRARVGAKGAQDIDGGRRVPPHFPADVLVVIGGEGAQDVAWRGWCHRCP